MGIRGTGHGLRAVVTLLCALLPALVVLAGCGDTSGGGSASPEPSATPMTLKVMEFNIEYGGDTVDFDKVLEAMKKAQPDIIGLEEAETSTGRIAKATGYAYWSNATQVVSRYPLLEPPEADGQYLYVQVRARPLRGRLANVHLPSDEPGPHLIRIGKPVEKVVATEEAVRLPVHPGPARGPAAAGEAGHPRRSCSATSTHPRAATTRQEVVGTRDYVKYVVDWPVSKAVEAAGFIDSWRAVYPDPLQSLGLTWWAARPRVDG